MKPNSFNKTIVACCAIALVAAAGLLTSDPAAPAAYAETKSPPKDAPVSEEALSAGIKFPWNHGWSPGINVVPGLPIQLSFENKELTFSVTADGAQLVNWAAGNTRRLLPSMFGRS